jgi:uncharacterized membrane protein
MFDITLFHPQVVHFTIALFSVYVLFEILGVLTGRQSFRLAAWMNLLFAGAAAIVTVLTGLLAANNVAHNDAAHEIMERHETIGFIVLGIILLLVVWRLFLKGKLPGKLLWLYIVVALVGVGTMFFGAYLGGEMVYTYGVAVKAVPLSEEAGHHHEYGSDSDTAGEHLEMEEHHDLDTSASEASPDSTVTEVHRHTDGSEHVHQH